MRRCSVSVRVATNASLWAMPAHLPATLTPGQTAAARVILGNRDFMSVLVGDAGTGKTTVLTAIEGRARCGWWSAVRAPRTDHPSARCNDREWLCRCGHCAAVSGQLKPCSFRRRAVSYWSMRPGCCPPSNSTKADEDRPRRARPGVTGGDTKQHYSVQRGDALRNVIKHSGTPVVRLRRSAPAAQRIRPPVQPTARGGRGCRGHSSLRIGGD